MNLRVQKFGYINYELTYGYIFSNCLVLHCLTNLHRCITYYMLFGCNTTTLFITSEFSSLSIPTRRYTITIILRQNCRTIIFYSKFIPYVIKVLDAGNVAIIITNKTIIFAYKFNILFYNKIGQSVLEMRIKKYKFKSISLKKIS